MPLFANASILQTHDPIRSVGDRRIMRNHHDRKALTVLLGDEIQDLRAGLLVEVARRLIGQQDLRVVHQCPGDRNALALAAGELARPVPQPVPEPEGLQQIGGVVANGPDPSVLVPAMQPDQRR